MHYDIIYTYFSTKHLYMHNHLRSETVFSVALYDP
jgi:hypothetical protein